PVLLHLAALVAVFHLVGAGDRPGGGEQHGQQQEQASNQVHDRLLGRWSKRGPGPVFGTPGLGPVFGTPGPRPVFGTPGPRPGYGCFRARDLRQTGGTRRGPLAAGRSGLRQRGPNSRSSATSRPSSDGLKNTGASRLTVSIGSLLAVTIRQRMSR